MAFSASPTGISDVMGGEGLSMERIEAPFALRVPPQADRPSDHRAAGWQTGEQGAGVSAATPIRTGGVRALRRGRRGGWRIVAWCARHDPPHSDALHRNIVEGEAKWIIEPNAPVGQIPRAIISTLGGGGGGGTSGTIARDDDIGNE